MIVFVAWTQAAAGEISLDFMLTHFVLSLQGVQMGQVWTLLTSAFSHRDATHLLVNMVGIWFFGMGLTPVADGKDLIQLVVVGAILGSIGYILHQLIVEGDSGALGASGAAATLALAYALCFPRRKLLLFFFIPLPATVAAGAFILFDFAGLAYGGTGIAHAAHLVGAAWGVAWWWFVGRRRLSGSPSQSKNRP